MFDYQRFNLTFHGSFDLLLIHLIYLVSYDFSFYKKRLADDTKLYKGIRRQVSVNTKTSDGTTVNDIMLCNQADMKDIKDIKKYLEAEKQYVLKQKKTLEEQESKFVTEQDIFRNRLKTLTIENQLLLEEKEMKKRKHLPITKTNKKMIEILDEVDDDKTIFSEHTVEKNVNNDSPDSKINKKKQSKSK